jgi:hypothetical protein
MMSLLSLLPVHVSLNQRKRDGESRKMPEQISPQKILKGRMTKNDGSLKYRSFSSNGG